jgi:pimeloyl-ACP methyl ester carboxylesterase
MSGRSFLLDVAGGRRRIRVFEAGDGPPLVFLHGAGESRTFQREVKLAGRADKDTDPVPLNAFVRIPGEVARESAMISPSIPI